LGEHSRPILQNLLGYDDVKIDELRSQGVIALWEETDDSIEED
jgi:hypothetical protein